MPGLPVGRKVKLADISARRWAGMVMSMIIAAFTFAWHSPIYAKQADCRFGVVEPHDAPESADGLGAGWGRVRFHWALIQPHGPTEWVEAEFNSDELAREQAAGRQIIALLIGIPAWAREQTGLPRGLYLPNNDPGNLWASYVREAVRRYRGQIDHWIIWNEPDVWNPEHPGYTWPGDEADYVQLLKVAYLTAKEANPDAVIHLAAVSHWWDALYSRELYFRRLLDVLVSEPEASRYDHYYDAATLHLYFDPVAIYDLIQLYADIQSDHGIAKPIWLIETNAAPSSDPTWTVEAPTFHVSLLEQAAYMPQVLSLALAADAERVGIYKLIDTPGDYAANPEPFGLLRADGSPRPAYKTAQIAIRQLADAEQVLWTERGSVAQVEIHKPDQFVRLLWSRLPTGQTVQIPALSDKAILMDMWGNRSPIMPVRDLYTLTLFGGECQQTVGDYCMIGGPPVYLIETLVPSRRVPDSPRIASISESTSSPATAVPTERLGGGLSGQIALAVGLALILAMGGMALRKYVAMCGCYLFNRE